MIVVRDIEQGTPEWHALRLGIPTGSQITKLITPKSKAKSSQSAEWLITLLAEWASGEGADEDGYESFWMTRGKELEPEARAAFRLITGFHVEPVTFIYKDDDRMCGVSPDGLVVSDDGQDLGGLELKCPKKVNHVAHMIRDAVPDNWMAQVQFSLWVSGLPRWWFMSYHPDCDEFLVEIEPDKSWQDAFDEHVPGFIKEIQAGRDDSRIQALRS